MSALPSQRTPAIVYAEDPGVFYDTIIVLGRTQDMTGAVVTFSLRALESRVPILNNVAATAIVPTNANGNNVSYTWGSAPAVGDYMAWWTFTLPGIQAQDSPEFPIYVSDHGPGLGAKTGL